MDAVCFGEQPELFKVASTLSLQRCDSEAQFADFLKRVPSSATLAGPEACEPCAMDCCGGVPRVPSLDYIKAFLNASRPVAELAQQPLPCPEPIVQSMLPFNVPVAMDLKRAAAASKLEPITVMAASPRPVSADSTGGAASDPCSPCAADARARGSADALPSMALGGPAAARVTCPTPAIGPFPALPISALAAPTGAPAVLAPAALAAALMAQGGAVGAVPLGLFAAAAAAGGAAVVMPPLPAALLCSAAATGAAGGGGIGGSSEPVLAAASSEPNNNNSHGCSQADRSELRRARRMLSNRESARRSRKRKQEHLTELEHQIALLEAARAELVLQLRAAQEATRTREAEVLALRHENARLQAAVAAATAAQQQRAQQQAQQAQQAQQQQQAPAHKKVQAEPPEDCPLAKRTRHALRSAGPQQAQHEVCGGEHVNSGAG